MQLIDDDYMGNIDLDAVIHYSLSTFRGGVIHGLSHWENVEKKRSFDGGKKS